MDHSCLGRYWSLEASLIVCEESWMPGLWGWERYKPKTEKRNKTQEKWNSDIIKCEAKEDE